MPMMLIAAALLAAAAPGVEPINAHDPVVLEQQLREMGFEPDPFKLTETSANTVLHLSGGTLAVSLGGCTKGKNCTYVVLVGSFNDILKPPADWVARMNVNYDLIKVWVRDDGKLAYSAGGIVDGIPRSVLRRWIERVEASSDDLGAEAVKAGYGPKK